MAWVALFVVHVPAKLLCAGAMSVTGIVTFGLYRFGYENGYWDLVRR